MAGEGDDPFGVQFNICQPCTSDAVKLQDCPALRLSDVSPDLDSDTDFEQTPLSSTPTELTRIHMVSPPESESDSEEDSPSSDRIAPLENDVFHTPPEHYNRRSSSSSQEFLSQREKAVAANGVVDEQIQPTARVEDGVQLEGDENLEIEGTAELEEESEGDLDTQSSEDPMNVDGIVQTEPSLKKYSVLIDELRKAARRMRGSPSAVTDGSQPVGDVTLGVSGMVESDRNDGDSDIQCSQNAMGGDSVFRAESNLKGYSFVDEIREFSKKIVASKEKSKGGTPSTFAHRLQPKGDETLVDPRRAGLGGNDEDSEIHCSQNVTGVNKVVRAETSLNRYTLLVDELREFSKKLIAAKENRKCDMLSHGQTDSQMDCTEESTLGKGPEERIEEKAGAEEKDRAVPCLDSALGKCDGGLKDIENEGISVTHVDLTAMDLAENGGINTEEKLDKKAVEEPCSVDIRDTAPRKSIGGKRKSRNEDISVIDLDSVEENNGIGVQNEDISVIDLDSVEEINGIGVQNKGLENAGTTLDCEITRVEGSKELTDCGSAGGGVVVNNEKVGEACLVTSNVDLSVKASSKVILVEENPKKLTDGESSLCSKNIKETNTKETEGFTNEGCVSDSNNPCNKEVLPGKRRELPSSLRRKENESSTQKGKKRSWQELLCACEVYFKKDESLKDVDFLETAKRRGLTFP